MTNYMITNWYYLFNIGSFHFSVIFRKIIQISLNTLFKYEYYAKTPLYSFYYLLITTYI